MKRKNPFLYIGLAFSSYIVISNILSIIAVKLLLRFSSAPSINLNLSILLSTAVQYLIAVPVAIAVMKQVPASKAVGHKMRLRDFISFYIMLFPIAILGNIIGRIVNYAISITFKIPVYNPVDIVLNKIDPVLMLLLIGILAPIMEEFFTRKLIIDRTIEHGQGISIVFSATIFALIHGNFYQSFYAFGLGACFAYVYVKTGKLRYSSLMHILINSGSVFLMILLRNSGLMSVMETESHGLSDIENIISTLTPLNYAASLGIFLYFTAYLTFIIIGIVLWVKRRRKLQIQPGSLAGYNKTEKAKILFLNWGMLIFILLSIYTFIDNIMMTVGMS